PHHVDLAARRPAGARDVRAEHPDRGPAAAPAGQLRAHLEAAVAQREASERVHAGRRVAVALVALLAALDHEHAALDAHVLEAGGVVLLLVVADVADLVAPLRRVEAPGRLELVREDEREAGGSRGRGGGRRGRRRLLAPRAGCAAGWQRERESERRELPRAAHAHAGLRSLSRSRISVSSCTSAGGGAAATSRAATFANGFTMKRYTTVVFSTKRS